MAKITQYFFLCSLCFLSINLVRASDSVYQSPSKNYSFVLPASWEQVSSQQMDSLYKNASGEAARSGIFESTGLDVFPEYDAAFQFADGNSMQYPYLKYPYLLIQEHRFKGKVNFSELIRTLESNFGKANNISIKEFLMLDFQSPSLRFYTDNAKQTAIKVLPEMNLPMGQTKFLTVMLVRGNTIINLYFYCLTSELDQFKIDLYKIIESFKFAGDQKPQSFRLDNYMWLAALIGFLWSLYAQNQKKQNP